MLKSIFCFSISSAPIIPCFFAVAVKNTASWIGRHHSSPHVRRVIIRSKKWRCIPSLSSSNGSYPLGRARLGPPHATVVPWDRYTILKDVASGFFSCQRRKLRTRLLHWSCKQLRVQLASHFCLLFHTASKLSIRLYHP